MADQHSRSIENFEQKRGKQHDRNRYQRDRRGGQQERGELEYIAKTKPEKVVEEPEVDKTEKNKSEVSQGIDEVKEEIKQDKKKEFYETV